MLEIKTDLKFLRKRSKEVDQITDEIRELVVHMAELMKRSNGVGLAAPQVGHLKRIIIVKDGDGFTSFVNPVILSKSKEKDILEEGCLSIPDYLLEIKRPTKIKIQALNIKGEEVVSQLEGLAARIFQHEVDHLNGILIIDRIPFIHKVKKTFFK